jgi:hypothetical protein
MKKMVCLIVAFSVLCGCAKEPADKGAKAPVIPDRIVFHLPESLPATIGDPTNVHIKPTLPNPNVNLFEKTDYQIKSGKQYDIYCSYLSVQRFVGSLVVRFLLLGLLGLMLFKRSFLRH